MELSLFSLKKDRPPWTRCLSKKMLERAAIVKIPPTVELLPCYLCRCSLFYSGDFAEFINNIAARNGEALCVESEGSVHVNDTAFVCNTVGTEGENQECISARIL